MHPRDAIYDLIFCNDRCDRTWNPQYIICDLVYQYIFLDISHNQIFFIDRDCIRTKYGLEYRGDRNTTATEEAPCQKWSDFFTDEDMSSLHHREDTVTMQDKCRMLHGSEEMLAGPFCKLADYPYVADCGIPYCGNSMIYLCIIIWG